MCNMLLLASSAQTVRRSLDAESAATLVHAFVTSRVDYCNGILAGASKSTTNKLQLVKNAAARVVSDTIADSPIYYTTSCIGWTFPSGCSTSCVQRFTDVCSTRHHSTRKTAASTPRTLLVGSTCNLLAAVSCWCRNNVNRCSVSGLFCGRPGGLELVTRLSS